MAKRKLKPTITPGEFRQPVIRAKGDEPLKISLNISGGVHSEKYDFNFELDDKRNISCNLDCKMSKRKRNLKKAVVNEREWKQVIAGIESSGILNSAEYRGGFIPCTLVGTLKIEMGDKVYQSRFIADAEQAKMQKRNTAQMDRTVDMIFGLAAKKMKIKSAKP